MVAFAVLAASIGIFSLGQACPIDKPEATPEAKPVKADTRAVEYKTFRGDGSADEGWPEVSSWKDFDSIWEVNLVKSAGACKWLGLAPNSDSESATMKAAVLEAADETGLDARYIAAVLFKESDGCVRVKTSVSPNAGVRNPGLFQSANGEYTCNDLGAGTSMQNPCPARQIEGMVNDGVGITTDWGLQQVVEKSGASDVSKYYKAAVLYNSGVMPDSGDLEDGRSNPCYASDIANIVLGWTAESSPCNRDTIGN